MPNKSMFISRDPRVILLYFLVAVISFSCVNKKKISSGKVSSGDTAGMRYVFYDTVNLPRPLMESHRLHVKASQKLTAGQQIVLYTGPNFTGESQSLDPGRYEKSSLAKFLGPGIRSIKVPFGLCTDILYETDRPVINQSDIPHDRGHNIFGNTESFFTSGGDMNRYYAPGDYSNVEPLLKRPGLVTIYPWTDFYFSSDDPALPEAVVVIGATTNGDRNTPYGSVIYNPNSDKYFKHFSYKIPVNKHVTLWEATKNGEGGWGYRIDKTDNTLLVELWITKRSLAGPRKWMGVRVSRID